MQVIVADHYSDTRHHLEGSEDDVRSQLLNLYPHLLTQYGNSCSVDLLVKSLNKSQFCSAKVVPTLEKRETDQGEDIDMKPFAQHPGPTHGQLNTIDKNVEACRAAAEFLAGHACTDKEMRQALLECDGDNEKAALLACGLSFDLLKDLRGVLSATLKKSEEKVIKFSDVSATTTSSKDFANIVKRANENGEIKPVKLGEGKHTSGTLLARDNVTHQSYILKPGAGKQNPIVGETESGSSQSQREACFYSVATSWGLGSDMPECHILLIDKKEYACMTMLPYTYKNMNDLKAQDLNLPRRLLSLYNDDTLHKWATLDYVLGNPDRHAGNLMASGDKVKLIDHGSTFAGVSFNPATDGMSFVPYYLRPGVIGFNKLSVDEKLRKLPRLNPEIEKSFRKWLLDLSSDIMGHIIMMYGIDPQPEQNRLNRLQSATSYQSADLAILSCWVVG
jgi:hypothetical protein